MQSPVLRVYEPVIHRNVAGPVRTQRHTKAKRN
jgi:hypothetical protein